MVNQILRLKERQEKKPNGSSKVPSFLSTIDCCLFAKIEKKEKMAKSSVAHSKNQKKQKSKKRAQSLFLLALALSLCSQLFCFYPLLDSNKHSRKITTMSE